MDIPAPFDGVVKEVRSRPAARYRRATDRVDGSWRRCSSTGERHRPLRRQPLRHRQSPRPPRSLRRPPHPLRVHRQHRPQPQPRQAARHASRSIRRFARELGVNLALVKGSGEKGRVTRTTCRTSSSSRWRSRLPLRPAAATACRCWLHRLVDFRKFGTIETSRCRAFKKISGANLHRNWVTIPHVTQFDEADITEMEAFRKELNTEYAKQNIKITRWPS